MFMGKLPQAVGAARPHIDAGTLSAFLVYVREAHPTDGWSNPNGLLYAQTRTLEGRLRVAGAFHEAKRELLQGVAVLVDDPATHLRGDAVPRPGLRRPAGAHRRLVDAQMSVVFATGCGPLQYDVAAFADFLETRLAA